MQPDTKNVSSYHYCLLTTLASYVLIVVAISGTRYALWHFRISFILIAIAAVAGLVVSGLVLRHLINKSPPDSRCTLICWTTLVFSPLPFLILLYKAVPVFQMPMIHDISTDTVNPPVFSAARSLRTPTDHSVDYAGELVALQQRKAFPDIKTLHLERPLEVVSIQVKDYITDRGWLLVSGTNDMTNIEAVVASPLFRFKDDLVIRLKPVGEATLVDIRSASRVGKSDLGQNAQRIRELVNHLN